MLKENPKGRQNISRCGPTCPSTNFLPSNRPPYGEVGYTLKTSFFTSCLFRSCTETSAYAQFQRLSWVAFPFSLFLKLNKPLWLPSAGDKSLHPALTRSVRNRRRTDRSSDWTVLLDFLLTLPPPLICSQVYMNRKRVTDTRRSMDVHVICETSLWHLGDVGIVPFTVRRVVFGRDDSRRPGISWYWAGLLLTAYYCTLYWSQPAMFMYVCSTLLGGFNPCTDTQKSADIGCVYPAAINYWPVQLFLSWIELVSALFGQKKSSTTQTQTTGGDFSVIIVPFFRVLFCSLTGIVFMHFDYYLSTSALISNKQ